MLAMYHSCAGVDVHSKLIVVCLLRGRKNKEIREFGATTAEILSMCDWLKEAGCEIVAMESTGSYWKPVYNLLEVCGLKAIVVNAHDMKNVPGKKTDIKDAEWIADLLRHGLLNASYIPKREQRELREMVTYRRSLVQMKASEINRYQKILEGANIKLSEYVSNIMGMSASALMHRVIAGEEVTAADIRALRSEGKVSGQLKATPEELAAALNGELSSNQRMLLASIMDHIKFLSHMIDDVDKDIGNAVSDMGDSDAVEAIAQMPGIGEDSAQCIIAAIGSDLHQFPSAGHLASWAGLCPGNNESAGKRRNGKTRKGNQLLRTTLVLCAHAAVKVKNSFFCAQFHKLVGRRGKKKAYVAVAHSMLIAIYHVLKEKIPYKELGSEYYLKDNVEQKVKNLTRQFEKLGYSVTLTSAAKA